MTVGTSTKQTTSPNAARDPRANCASAQPGVGEGTEERVELLVKAGVDALIVDTAHGQPWCDRARALGEKNFRRWT